MARSTSDTGRGTTSSIALQFLTPRMTLLIFAVAVGLGILAAAPFLVRPPTRTQTRRTGVTHHGDALSGARERPAR